MYSWYVKIVQRLLHHGDDLFCVSVNAVLIPRGLFFNPFGCRGITRDAIQKGWIIFSYSCQCVTAGAAGADQEGHQFRKNNERTDSTRSVKVRGLGKNYVSSFWDWAGAKALGGKTTLTLAMVVTRTMNERGINTTFTAADSAMWIH